MGTLANLPPIDKAASPTGGFSFLRKLAKQAKAEEENAAKRKAQDAHATVKKLLKLAKANGLSVSGVSIGMHGVTVNTVEAPSAKTDNVSANPWDEAV
jgi:hypothetical protein